MSISLKDIGCKIKTQSITIKVSNTTALMTLYNHFDWEQLMGLIIKDLEKTPKGKFFVGRRLDLRQHMAIYILQTITNLTDRQLIQAIRYNAEYRLFCGLHNARRTLIHFSRIAVFRSRISKETLELINAMILQLATKCGLVDAKKLDIDSTVQEANISYPTDASLVLKMAKKAYTLTKRLKLDIKINIHKISKLAQMVFFRSKKATEQEANKLLKRFVNFSTKQLMPVIAYAEDRLKEGKLKVKWNTRKLIQELGNDGRKFLKDAKYFVNTGKAKKDKIFSLHAKEVACINKGKLNKKYEFGRLWHIGRLAGNFIYSIFSSVNLHDKLAIEPMLNKHEQIFGKGVLKSLATDKGYYSSNNIQVSKDAGIKQIGIQKPGQAISTKLDEKLRRRRAGIEPCIGHLKRMGLGRSRMKNDTSTHTSGMRVIIGFNMQQLSKKLINIPQKYGG